MTAWQFHLLGYAVRLAEPAYLLVSGAALLGGLLLLWLMGARAGRLDRIAPARLRARILPAVAPHRALARGLLGWSGLLLGGLALAQPQCGSHTQLTKQYGIDLVIALDASKSMLARDVKPSRIERAKLELSGLLDKLKGDRVGLVVFSGDAFVQCPLTSDYAAAKMFLRAIDPANMPVPGTNVGRALDTSRDLLMEAERGAKSRAIVLLSDGEDFGDEVDESAKALKADGIKVITVGIGSAAGEPIPQVDKHGAVVGYVKDKQGNTVMTRLNENGLEQLADETDGTYVASVPGSIGVAQVSQELERMQKAELESRLTVSYEERYALFLGPALALLALGAALRSGRTRHGLLWLLSGLLLAVACACFSLLGFSTLIDKDAVRTLVFSALAVGGALAYVAALVLDRFVRRQEAGR